MPNSSSSYATISTSHLTAFAAGIQPIPIASNALGILLAEILGPIAGVIFLGLLGYLIWRYYQKKKQFMKEQAKVPAETPTIVPGIISDRPDAKGVEQAWGNQDYCYEFYKHRGNR